MTTGMWILVVVYMITAILLSYGSFLYWYAYIKANRNVIIGSVAILMTAFSFDTIYFTLCTIGVETLLENYFIIIPKIAIIIAMGFFIHSSFKDIEVKRKC